VRACSKPTAEKTLHVFQQIQHNNILSALTWALQVYTMSVIQFAYFCSAVSPYSLHYNSSIHLNQQESAISFSPKPRRFQPPFSRRPFAKLLVCFHAEPLHGFLRGSAKEVKVWHLGKKDQVVKRWPLLVSSSFSKDRM